MPIPVEKQIEQLREQLRYHSYQYYVLDDPDVPDAEYDRLYNQLLALEEENPHLVTTRFTDATGRFDTTRSFRTDTAPDADVVTGQCVQ